MCDTTRTLEDAPVHERATGIIDELPAAYWRRFALSSFDVFMKAASSEAILKNHWRPEMKFLMMIKHAESDQPEPIPQALMDAMGKFVGDGFASGVLKDTAGLKRTAEGLRVRSKGGKLHVSDGPFTEAKEVVGGYAIIEVNSKEEALENARQFMELHRVHWPSFECECEVRQLDM